MKKCVSHKRVIYILCRPKIKTMTINTFVINAIWFALLIPIGIVVERVYLTQFKNTSWIGSVFGMGLACLGLQVAMTVIYTYCADVSIRMTLSLIANMEYRYLINVVVPPTTENPSEDVRSILSLSGDNQTRWESINTAFSDHLAMPALRGKWWTWR
jgi:hypothetical protein